MLTNLFMGFMALNNMLWEGKAQVLRTSAEEERDCCCGQMEQFGRKAVTVETI